MRTSTPLLLVASAALLLLSLVAPAASLFLRDECTGITSGGGCSTGGCGGENTGSCATCIACVSTHGCDFCESTGKCMPTASKAGTLGGGESVTSTAACPKITNIAVNCGGYADWKKEQDASKKLTAAAADKLKKNPKGKGK